MQTIQNGRATGVIINDTVHVLKPSSSRFHLRADGIDAQYCCIGSCCDDGLRSDVRAVIEAAKSLSAKRVVLRTSQHEVNNRAVASLGLPLSDVSEELGDADEWASVYAAW